MLCTAARYRSTEIHTNADWWLINAVNNGQNISEDLSSFKLFFFLFKCGDKCITLYAEQRALSSRGLLEPTRLRFRDVSGRRPSIPFNRYPAKMKRVYARVFGDEGQGCRETATPSLSHPPLCLTPAATVSSQCSSICFSASKVTSDGVGGRQRGVG